MAVWNVFGTIPSYGDPDGAIENGVSLGEGIRLEPIPSWVKSPYVCECLSFPQRDRLRSSAFAFRLDLDIAGITQDIENETGRRIRLANLACWIARPSPITHEVVLFFDRPPNGNSVPTLETFPRIEPLPSYQRQGLRLVDVIHARTVHLAARSLAAPNAVLTALRALWLALLERSAFEIRYLLYWLAIEALFGSTSEISYRVALRGALFLERDPKRARALYQSLRSGYNIRSQIAHGNRPKGLAGKLTGLCEEAERFLHRSLQRILTDPTLTNIFATSQREDYLDDLAFR